MAKKKKQVKITPIGYSAQSVTGSCLLVEYLNHKILLEYGGIQEMHTPLANYKANKEQLSKIKPQEIDLVFIAHAHYDHIGLIPALCKNGKFQGRIIAPKGSSPILEEMWKDSAHIMERDCEYLSRKTGKIYLPFYDHTDISIAMSHIDEYGQNEIYALDDNLSFRYTPSGHIFLGEQIELFITPAGHTYKILYTSDLGNVTIQDEKFFVDHFSPVSKANIVIGESTYGGEGQKNKRKDYQKDIEKIRSVIHQYCIDHSNRVLFPTFSLDRMPFMMWIIYSLFKNDPSFHVPVLIDSPLAIRLLNHYSSILSGETKQRFDQMRHWQYFKYIVESEDSQAAMKDSRAKIILSSGGMLQSGRSVQWAQSIIPRSGDCIVFSGYCGEGTLGYKIKHSKEQKTITINHKVLSNRCQMAEITSLSGHMQHADLVNYYKSIRTDAIYLLHGSPESRAALKEDLDAEIKKNYQTTKVKIINKSTVISL